MIHKASYYVNMIKVVPTADTVKKVMLDMLQESTELINQRHAKTPYALFGVLNEIDTKWRKIASEVKLPGAELKEDGFRSIVHKDMPDIYIQWMDYRNKTMARKHV